MDIDRCGVAYHHLVIGSTHKSGDQCAERVGQHEPAGLVPAGDQVLRPFLFGGLADLRECRLGCSAQGIAVKIDHAIGQVEPVAKRSQRILCVEPPDIIECDM